MTILSYPGQTHRTQLNVVEQPAFLRSDQKPLRWWAQGGLIYCIDPNQPNKKPTYSQPLDALRRVAYGIKIFMSDLRQNPQDYVITQQALANFFSDFKQKVFDVALEQDAQNGSFIERSRIEYTRSKEEAEKQARIEEAAAKDKKPKIFLAPKASRSSAVEITVPKKQ